MVKTSVIAGGLQALAETSVRPAWRHPATEPRCDTIIAGHC